VQSQQHGREKKREQTAKEGDNYLKKLLLDEGHPVIPTYLNQLSEGPVELSPCTARTGDQECLSLEMVPLKNNTSR
jgi:hypothetical protein